MKRFFEHVAVRESAWPRVLGAVCLLPALALIGLSACGPRPSPRSASIEAQTPGAPGGPSPSPAPRVTTRSEPLPAASVVDVRLVRRTLTDTEAADYVGDAACARCHPAIAARQARSSHANTIRPASATRDGSLFLHRNIVRDPKNGFAYTTTVQQGRCLMVESNGRVEASLPADYVFGTGRHAFSYLSRDDQNDWVTLRLSYYTEGRRWDFSGGQMPGRPLTTTTGIELSGAEVVACLQCHATVLRPKTTLRKNAAGDFVSEVYPDMTASHLNIGCERCHGPGKAHIDAMTRATPSRTPAPSVAGSLAPKRWETEDFDRATPEQVNAMCGYCHRTPQNTDTRDPHNELDVPRFEGVALARSACYRQSGTLSCITCHDPHTDADPSLARNDGICLRCHTRVGAPQRAARVAPGAASAPPKAGSSTSGHSTKARICPINPRTGCSGCHMPRQTLPFGPGVRYTNHWIKVWRPMRSASARPTASPR